MLQASAYVDWQATEHEEVPHPSAICEPINLAATEQPALVYRMASSCHGLSTMQTETIRRIMQSFAQRQSFLLGDATGVGKGRTIAGLIAEVCAARQDVHVVWVSASMRLEQDARQELTVVEGPSFDEHVKFTSYTAIQNAERADRLVAWLTSCAFPLVVLDECHALRNSRGISYQSIENLLKCTEEHVIPSILYSSATACSLPRHMAYLGRLGLFASHESPFPTFDALSKALRSHGTSLMELIAIDLRSRGAYVARQLSFTNVCVEHRVVALTAAQRDVYDACGRAFREIDVCGGSTHQAFFQRLITGFKTEEAIRIAEEHIQSGSSVVISLVNTGEASQRRLSANEAYPGHAHALQRVGDEMLSARGAEPVDGLPINPLDRIIDHFKPNRIAELTGRRHRLVRQHGRLAFARNPPLHEQVAEFQSGAKHVAVLSRAGGTGISLHDAQDGRPRTHIILEMPWSAEDLLQQMGRTHRSSSIHSPSYVMVTTDVPAEMRFASSVVSKLESFGALVKADRTNCYFSFLKVPRWTPRERRSIGLYLAMAGALREDDRIPDTMSRHQALSVCQCDEQTGETQLKARLTQLLSKADEFEDHRTAIVGATKRLFPQDVTMLLQRWRPELHGQFPFAFRQRVFALLLCTQAWEAQTTLGLLSKDLVLNIIESMASPVSTDAAKLACLRFKQHALDDVGTSSMETILNRMLGMEWSVQQNVLNLADMLVQPETQPPNACFLRYADERAGPCIQTVVADIMHASFEGGVRGVRVDVHYTILQPPSPSNTASFWRHVKSGRTCWTDGERRMVFADCSEVQAQVHDAALLRGRNYFPCARRDWNEAVTRLEANALKRAKKLPCRFYFATVHALRAWEASTHRVFRVPPTALFPQGIVGLLMYTKN